MADNEAPEVGEYADDKGNTWQLTADEAKRLGYTAVTNKVVKAEAVDDKAVAPKRTTNK